MPRQPNRRPSIFKGSDGLYHCYVTLGTKPNGKLDRRHRQGTTATEVGRKVDELLGQAARGGGVPQKVDSVDLWLVHWVDHVIKPKRAWKTYAGYRSAITCHLIPHVGAWRLDGHRRRLEPEHVEAMYAHLGTPAPRGAGLSSAYVLQIHRILRKALKDAVRRGKASRNVCDLIDPPTARPRKVDAHTVAELDKIVAAAVRDPFAARWLLGLLLGPRQGEALGLRWHRVHLDPAAPTLPYVDLTQQLQRRTWEHGCTDPQACARQHCRTAPCRQVCPDHRARKGCTRACRPRCTRHTRPCPPPCPAECTGHARRCAKRHGGGLVDADLKTAKAERTLQLPPVLVELLRTHRAAQQQLLSMQGLRWSEQGYVFTTAAGKPLDPRGDHARWEQLLRDAGVRDSRLHAARHTAGTMMLATGTDIRVVQEVLGHTKITTTQVYVDVAQELKREAVDRAVAAMMDGQLAALLRPADHPAPPPSDRR